MNYFINFVYPDLIRYFLLAANGTLIFVTVLMFVTLIAHKILVERRRKRLNTLHHKYTDLLAGKLSDPGLALEKPGSDLEFGALGDAIIDMMLVSESGVVSRLDIIAQDLGLESHYRESATSHSWVERYRAIEKLGYLRQQELEPFFSSLLQKEKNIHVVAKTIWALSLIAKENDLELINSLLADPLFASSKFKEYIYTNIIRAFQERGEESVFLRLLDFWKDKSDIPMLLKKDIISACGVAGLTSAGKAVMGYYERFQEVPKMKIACIRALERLGEPDMCPVIISSLHDEDWMVRAVAAKNAEVCSDAVAEALESVLKDSNYYVRINAAQALSKLGEKGKAALIRLTSSDDHFARDMAQYILNR